MTTRSSTDQGSVIDQVINAQVPDKVLDNITRGSFLGRDVQRVGTVRGLNKDVKHRASGGFIEHFIAWVRALLTGVSTEERRVMAEFVQYKIDVLKNPDRHESEITGIPVDDVIAEEKKCGLRREADGGFKLEYSDIYRRIEKSEGMQLFRQQWNQKLREVQIEMQPYSGTNPVRKIKDEND